MIFKKMCGAAAIIVSCGALIGCNTTDGAVTVRSSDGQIVRKLPVDVAQLPDNSLAVFVRSQDQGLTIADSAIGSFHCRGRVCKPVGGGMVGSSGAAPIISAGLNTVGMLGFGSISSGGGGGSSSVAFNNTVSASSNLKSSIKNNGGNNAGIGNASIRDSGNSVNVNNNRANAGANAQNFNSSGGKQR